MMIISRTPVRISLFGGGTDYPSYYALHGGAILGMTINKYIYISVNTLSDFFEHKIRIGYSKTELVKTPDEIQHPSIRECLKFKGVERNLDIHIFSDLPAKTGLGSSSSFTVGLLNALYALEGKKVSKAQLAQEACFVEQELIREAVGSQDQFHAAFGGFNVMEFSEEKIDVRPLLIGKEKKRLLQENMLIFYTGLTRFASDVVKEQIANTNARNNDRALNRMKEIVFEAERAISDCPKEKLIERLGCMMDESWQLKRGLSSRISNNLIDGAYDDALQAGAYGGKLCGAGSGGFLVLLVEPSMQPKVRKALYDFLEVPFKFEDSGTTIIYMKDD